MDLVTFPIVWPVWFEIMNQTAFYAVGTDF